MVHKHKDQRVGIFIDTQNLYHSAKNIHSAKVNFAAVVKAAAADRRIIRCIAYVVSSDSAEEKAFFDALTKAGIELKEKDLQVFSNGAKKADWDVGLAIDAVRIAPKLDVAVIVSGDGDFIPLVEYLRANGGCQVESVSFGRSTSGKLIEAVDDFIDLDKEPGRFLISGARRPAVAPITPAAKAPPATPAPVAGAAATKETVGRRRRGRRGGRGRGKKAGGTPPAAAAQ